MNFSDIPFDDMKILSAPSVKTKYQDFEFLEKIYGILKKINVVSWLDQGTLLGLYRDNRLLDSDHDLDLGVWHRDLEKVIAHSNIFEENGICVAHVPCQNCMYFFADTQKYLDLTFYEIKNENAIRNWVIHKDRFIIGQSFRKFNLKMDYFLESMNKSDSKAFLINLSKNNVFWLALSHLPKSWVMKSARIFKLLSVFSGNFFTQQKTAHLSVKVPKEFFEKLQSLEFFGSVFQLPDNCEKYLEIKYGDTWRTPRSDWIFWRDDGGLAD